MANASPRKVSLDITYKGTDLDEQIQSYVTGFSYTDVASGASDSISLTLENIDKKWLNEWYPEKGSTLTAGLTTKNWEKSGKERTLACGTFIIDDISSSGPPLVETISGVSVPASNGFKATKKSKTWEDVTIEQIASKIAEEAGISFYYRAPSIKIEEVEQSSATDSSFLYSLCEKYGLSMKVFNKKLIIFDEEIYKRETRELIDLNEKDFLSWSGNDTTEGTYTGVKLTYTRPSTNKTTTITVGTEERLYEYNAQVSSQYDAELQANAKLRNENKKIKTLEVKIMANLNIIATSIIRVTGLGKLDGLYYVDQVKHNVGSGYTMNISMHWFSDGVKEEREEKVEEYTVQPGDNLVEISEKFNKTGVYWRNIYEENKQTIEATAKKHGFVASDAGHWIFPGTVLKISPVIKE